MMLQLKTQSVLVVDDVVTYRKLLAGLLKKWGYQVFEAENGEQALALLEQQPINLLISDWEMPVMDGLSLCRQVRQLFHDRYIYLIMLTGRESVDDLHAGFAAGADDFLRKPVNQVELQARLHAGERVLQLETTLATRNSHLSSALRQLELDLQAAAAVQLSILPPHTIQLESYLAEWLFIPSAWVSGDIFNVFPLDHQAVGFYCVDVAGHGVTAAMMSVAVARQFLHGRTVDPFLFDDDNVTSPGQVVQILNERFCSQGNDVTSYFTMVYGVIDIASGEGCLCQAGHPTPFIVDTQGNLRQIGNGGPPIGLLNDLCWEESHFRLEPGERLVLYSDGISECEDPHHEMFGQQRLESLLSELRMLPLPALLEAVQHTLNRWRNLTPGKTAPVADDVSLLVIERQSHLTSKENDEN